MGTKGGGGGNEGGGEVDSEGDGEVWSEDEEDESDDGKRGNPGSHLSSEAYDKMRKWERYVYKMPIYHQTVLHGMSTPYV